MNSTKIAWLLPCLLLTNQVFCMVPLPGGGEVAQQESSANCFTQSVNGIKHVSKKIRDTHTHCWDKHQRRYACCILFGSTAAAFALAMAILYAITS